MKNANLDLVELLLQFPNVDIQTVDARGNSPSSMAVGQGNTDVADCISERRHHGTKWKGNYYYSSLWRIENRKLNLPAPWDLWHVDFGTSLLNATSAGDSAAVAEILAGNQPTQNTFVVDFNSEGLLNLASRSGDMDTLGILLQQPQATHLLSFKGSDGLTPLESALVVDSSAVIEKILVKVNSAQVVHGFVQANQFDFLRKILHAKRSLVDQCSSHSRTPLATAAWAGNTTIVEILLDKGATIDSRDWVRRLATPLWIAASKGHLETVRLLIQRGAEIELMAGEFPTKGPLNLGMLSPFPTQSIVVGIDNTARGQRNENTQAKANWVAASLGYKDIVSFLIQHGADIEARDSYFGMTPFWRAAQQNQPEVMRVLIEGGADIRTNRLVGWGRWREDTATAQ